MWFTSYVITVAVANVVTAATHPLNVFGLIVPWGTFVIGLTLLLRNMVQIQYGKPTVYAAIGTGLLVSALSSYMLGDTLNVTVASALSFVISESLDTEVFSRLKKKTMFLRILSGGGVGSILDSIIFVTVGLSPIGAGFLDWSEVPLAVCGQLIVKVAMQVIGAIALPALLHRKRITTLEVS